MTSPAFILWVILYQTYLPVAVSNSVYADEASCNAAKAQIGNLLVKAYCTPYHVSAPR